MRLLLATVFVFSALCFVAASSQAHIINMTPEAQRIQDGQCGRGFWWACSNKRLTAQKCLNQSGGHKQYCNGTVTQRRLGAIPVGSLGLRVCTINITFYHTQVMRFDNSCF